MVLEIICEGRLADIATVRVMRPRWPNCIVIMEIGIEWGPSDSADMVLDQPALRDQVVDPEH